MVLKEIIMASGIKVKNTEKILAAMNNTINDLLREKWELQKQIEYLMKSKQNENTQTARHTMG
jgi:hypothetical protein